MFKSLLLLAAFAAVAFAAGSEHVPQIVSQESEVEADGRFHYSFESDDGSKADQSGELHGTGEEAGEAVHGSYEYKGPDGQTFHVEYTADENGYQPVGEHIPQIPEAIARSIKWSEEHPYKEKA